MTIILNLIYDMKVIFLKYNFNYKCASVIFHELNTKELCSKKWLKHVPLKLHIFKYRYNHTTILTII